MEGRWRQLPRQQVERAKTEQGPWKAADSLEVSAVEVGGAGSTSRRCRAGRRIVAMAAAVARAPSGPPEGAADGEMAPYRLTTAHQRNNNAVR
jgi:hypothetical protein